MFGGRMDFWEAVVILTLISTAGWVIVTIVNKIGDVSVKKAEAKANAEAGYLRAMLAEIEEIKRRLSMK
jgi:hypothetical protein